MSTTASPLAGTFAADPVHSNFAFAVRYQGVSLFKGTLDAVEATLADGKLEGKAQVESISIRTPEQFRAHVLSDEFFAADKEMLRYEESWEESWRIHDPCTDPAARTRIRSHILLDPGRDTHDPRTTEVVFTVRSGSNMQRFHSCTIVYDEAPRTSSPVTLFA